MKSLSNRRKALKSMAAAAGLGTLSGSLAEAFAASQKALGPQLNGKINHSVCKWCYSKIPLETFAQDCKKIGLTSIELLGPEQLVSVKPAVRGPD